MGVISTLWASCVHPRKQTKEPPPSPRPLPPIPNSVLPEKPKKLVKKSSIRIVESPEPPVSPGDFERDHYPVQEQLSEKADLKPELEPETKPDEEKEKEKEKEKEVSMEVVEEQEQLPPLPDDTAMESGNECTRVNSGSTLTVDSLPPIEEEENEAAEAAAVEKQQFMDGTIDDDTKSPVVQVQEQEQEQEQEAEAEQESFSQSTTPELKQEEDIYKTIDLDEKQPQHTEIEVMPPSGKDSKAIARARMSRRKSLIEFVNMLQSTAPGLRFPLSPRMSISASTGTGSANTASSSETTSTEVKKARRELSIRIGSKRSRKEVEDTEDESLFRS